MKRAHISALAIIAVFLLAGCQKQEAPKSSTPPATAAPQVTAPAPWKMDLTTDPAKPEPNKDTKFRLQMTDPEGKPVAGADVTASLVMPVMDMGKNEFRLVDIGKGAYEGTGKFTMAGPWNVVVTAKAAGKTAQQTFPARVETKD
jgi:nitrogen fixation protein FixH